MDVRIFEKEAATLAAAGHEVHVRRLRAAEPATRTACASTRSAPSRPAPGSGGSHAGCLIAWRAARRLGADVYHLHDPELIPLAVLAAAPRRAASSTTRTRRRRAR